MFVSVRWIARSIRNMQYRTFISAMITAPKDWILEVAFGSNNLIMTFDVIGNVSADPCATQLSVPKTSFQLGSREMYALNSWSHEKKRLAVTYTFLFEWYSRSYSCLYFLNALGPFALPMNISLYFSDPSALQHKSTVMQFFCFFRLSNACSAIVWYRAICYMRPHSSALKIYLRSNQTR